MSFVDLNRQQRRRSTLDHYFQRRLHANKSQNYQFRFEQLTRLYTYFARFRQYVVKKNVVIEFSRCFFVFRKIIKRRFR